MPEEFDNYTLQGQNSAPKGSYEWTFGAENSSPTTPQTSSNSSTSLTNNAGTAPGSEVTKNEQSTFTPGMNVIDLAEVRGRRARRQLASNGFTTQDAYTGGATTYNAGALTDRDIKALAGTARSQERRDRSLIRQNERNTIIAQKYGLIPQNSWEDALRARGYTDDQINIRRNQVLSNARYTPIVAKNTATPSGFQYNYDLTNSAYSGDNAKWGNRAIDVLRAIYENKNEDVWKQMSNENGVVTFDSLLKYQNSLGEGLDFNDGYFGDKSLKAMLDNGTLTQAQYDNFMANPISPNKPSISTGTTDPNKPTSPTKPTTPKYAHDRTVTGIPYTELKPEDIAAAEEVWKEGDNIRANAKHSQSPFGISYSELSPEQILASEKAWETNGGFKYNPGFNIRSTTETGFSYPSFFQHLTIPTISFHKKGGTMKYFGTGGSVNAQQVQNENQQTGNNQLTELFQLIAANPTKIKEIAESVGTDANTLVQAMEEHSKNNPAAKAALSAVMQAQGTISVARLGTKLQYLKRLRGECPENFELVSFKAGGQLCQTCVKKASMAKCGKSIEARKNGGDTELVSNFKKMRCGGRAKANKKETGGIVSEKCGGKSKKKC